MNPSIEPAPQAQAHAIDIAPASPITVGMLGGMGPMSTVEAFRRITLATPATADQDHLHVIVDSDPAIPDRTLALLHEGPDPRPRLLASARRLVDAGADVICLPCNTAHAYFLWLSERVRVPIIHMLDETVTVTRKRTRSSCGLLATTGTILSGIYESRMRVAGLQLVVPDAKHQAQVSEVIAALKGGAELDDAAASCVPAAESLLAAGATTLVLGCTELSLLTNRLERDFPVVDALQAMVEATVDIALGRRPLPSL